MDIIALNVRAEALRKRLEALVQADAEAFLPVAAAYKLPKETPEQQTHKAAVLEKALDRACAVPLEVMAACGEGIALAAEYAEKGSVLARSDAGCAALFCKAAMQAAGLHFGPVSGRQPSAMGWMFKNRSECFSTGAFCNGQVMFVDGQAVASRATDSDALMRLAAYLEEETDDTYLKVYSLGDDFWDNDAYCVTRDAERVRRAMESGGNAWLKGEEAPCRPVVDDAPVFKANIWSARSREELAELRERVAAEVPELSLVFLTTACACSTSFRLVGTRAALHWSWRALWA